MRMDRRAKVITTVVLVLIAAGIVFLFYASGGTYLPAWFMTLAIAVMLLAALSIPRFILVSPHSVEIHCTMQLTKISIRDIKSIRFLQPSDMRFCFPVWGIYGVFGYYGYYFNLKKKSIVKVYASQWKNFVLIEDIYEELYIVSCDEAEELVKQIEQYK